MAWRMRQRYEHWGPGSSGLLQRAYNPYQSLDVNVAIHHNAPAVRHYDLDPAAAQAPALDWVLRYDHGRNEPIDIAEAAEAEER